MIRRKDSFGYIDFIRGKYVQNNIDQLQSIFNEMSIYEKDKIQNFNFDSLWKMMWGETNIGTQYRGEELASQKKFDALKSGIQTEDDMVTIHKFIENSTTSWSETEWEFPKGRRNFQEKDLDCALREFEEETGISKREIKIIDNLLPFEEIFLGSNHKSYKHKYFLAYTENATICLDQYQKTEVSKLEWKTIDECLASIRPYHLEKKQLITNINKVLEEYRLY
jgi:8-oxo-dGTP pyrophosphatase MutT (NUDIX family)